jgi:type II secretory pathway pseudopilin PulG
VPIAHINRHSGFILAEALVALLIVGVVFVALEASLSTVVRGIAESEREATAARLAESQRERAFGGPCLSGFGADSADAVVVTWSATANGSLIHLVQTSHFRSRFGDRIESYDAAGRFR